MKPWGNRPEVMTETHCVVKPVYELLFLGGAQRESSSQPHGVLDLKLTFYITSNFSTAEEKQNHFYPLSTSRNQVLVQSQCYCQFLVGSTGEPFKNRLLFHWLESQYRARTYVTEYVSCFVSLARQRQTQQTCSRCIAPLRSIGTQHTKAPRERSKTIKSRQLSSRSRCLAPNGPRSADPSRTSLNKLSTMADIVLLLTFMALRIYNGIQTRRIQRVRV